MTRIRAALSITFAITGMMQRAVVRAETPSGPVRIAILVSTAAQRFALPERWIYAVMRAESAGNPLAVSPKGAAGLMQIMPTTWAYLRARYQLGSNIYDPGDNILAGAGYLRELYDRYGAPGFLAAYNAGPQRYEASLRGDRPLPAETIAYVAKLAPIAVGGTADLVVARVDPLAWTSSSLFAGRTSSVAPDTESDSPQRSPEPPENKSTTVSRAPNGLFPSLSGQHPQ